MTIHLPQFLSSIDDTTKCMTREELIAFIHDLARKTPETKRVSFQNHIFQFIKHPEDNSQTSDVMSKLIADCIPKLEAIANENKTLVKEFNEEYDDWYDSDDEEYYFIDETNLLNDINLSYTIIRKCIDEEYFDISLVPLIDTIIGLHVLVKEKDYDEHEYMSIEDLWTRNLINFTYSDLLNKCAYLVYMIFPLEQRVQKIYALSASIPYRHISLEKIMQIGDKELPDFDQFLESWIQLLISKEPLNVVPSLKEAICFIKDDKMALHIAKNNANQHPYLYLLFFENNTNSFNDNELLTIGLEALKEIPEQYTVRSKIAYLTAAYADKLHNNDAMNHCYWEAFKSNTNAVNYLRLRYQTKNYEKNNNEIMKTINDLLRRDDKNDFIFEDALQINKANLNDFYAILFFENKFNKMIHLKRSNSYSTSNINMGLPFLFLLLNKKNTLQNGLKYMLYSSIETCHFISTSYYYGTNTQTTLTDTELFLNLFNKWKRHNKLSKCNEKHWLDYIEKETSNIVYTIVGHTHRSQYHIAAAFVCALGEVKESLDSKNTKENIILFYKNKFPRHSAFHKELDNLNK